MHFCGRRPWTGRKTEDMEMRKGRFFDKPAGIPEFNVTFSGKPDHHIRAKRDARDPFRDSCHEIMIEPGRIFPVHCSQDRIIPALEGNMEMSADPPAQEIYDPIRQPRSIEPAAGQNS
jgi:hypothetical protein